MYLENNILNSSYEEVGPDFSRDAELHQSTKVMKHNKYTKDNILSQI